MKKKAVQKAEPFTIRSANVVAPSRLEISKGNRNPETVMRWFEDVQLYVEAMDDLQRVTLLHHVADERKLYLSSIEDQPKATP